MMMKACIFLAILSYLALAMVNVVKNIKDGEDFTDIMQSVLFQAIGVSVVLAAAFRFEVL